MIVGFTVNLLLSASDLAEYAILPLFFALGLLFADYHMYKRLNDIDPDTGFYNTRYLSTLITYAKKKKLTGATVIRLKTSRSAFLNSGNRGFAKPSKQKAISFCWYQRL